MMGHTYMQAPYNQHAQFKSTLPCIFGKCLGLETTDPLAIQIRSFKKTPQKELNELEIIDYANENLPLSGKLITDDRGFTYLDIENEYIYELLPFLETFGATNPPYFDAIYDAGAHVSVILASEIHEPLNLENIEDDIPFHITGCYFVEPENWVEMETIWFLTIDAPKLSEIRRSVGLSDKIQDHEFHITFAVKKRFLSIHEIMSCENQTIVIKDLF